jgi:hypothetical protein
MAGDRVDVDLMVDGDQLVDGDQVNEVGDDDVVVPVKTVTNKHFISNLLIMIFLCWCNVLR